MSLAAARYRLGSGVRGAVVVAVLAALVGGVCMAAVAGARRTATAAERLAKASGEPDGFIDASATEPAERERIPELPSVEDSLEVAFTYAFAETDPNGYNPWLAPVGVGEDEVVLFAGYLVDGRRPEPGALDEIALPERVASSLELELGDTLRLLTLSPDAAQVAEETGEFEADGPTIDLEVVGLLRSSQTLLFQEDESVVTFLPNGFFERYRDEVGFADGLFIVNARGGADGLERLNRDLRETYPEGEVPSVDPGGLSAQALDDSMSVLSGGLLAFAAVVALFGALAVLQAVSRAVARRGDEQLALAGIGLGTRGRFLDAWFPVALAGIVGSLVAVGLAVVASPLLPVGLARRADPDVGFHVDLSTVAIGAGVVVAVTLAAGAVSAWRLAARTPGRAEEQIASVGRLAGRFVRSGRPAMAVGVGMATGSGRGTAGVPVRTAMAGVVVGVAGVAAVVVFGASLTRLLDTPARYGWTWDAAASFGDGSRGDIGITLDELRELDGVQAVGTGLFNVTVEVDGTPMYAMAIEPVSGEIEPPIAEGRAPVGPDEVALGADTQRELGHPDEVEVLDHDGQPHPFTVVGTAMFPTIDDDIALAEGALFSPEGVDALGIGDPSDQDTGFTQAVLRFEEGVDPAEVLPSPDSEDDAPDFPQASAEVARLDQVAGMPRLLAVFLGGLAAIAVGNALWQTVQRRRHELGVLRALGFDRRQVVASMGWQALALAVTGVAIGLPLGVAAGRWVWSLIAANLGVADDALTPTTTLLIAAVVIGLAALAGLGFGALAARRSAAAALRTE